MKIIVFLLCLLGLTVPVLQKGGGGPYVNSLLNGLVVYWSLDEASGNRVADWQDRTGLTLVDNNTVTQADGRIGKAAEFTAANSETLTLADNASLSVGNFDFTIAVWVYLGNQSTDRRVYHKGRGLAANEFAYALRYRQAGNHMRFAISDGSSATGVNSTETTSGSTWYLVVCQHDAAGDTIGVSVNGGAFTTAAWTTGSFDDADQLILGSDTAGTFYDGRIDALMMWKRKLTAAEIAYLYNSGNGRSPL